MSRPGATLTSEQKQDLMRMGRDGRFTLTKAGRVLGIHLEKLKNMIYRDSPEFFEQMVEAFPSALGDESEQDIPFGPQRIRYQDLGPIRIPGNLQTRALTQPWGEHRGA